MGQVRFDCLKIKILLFKIFYQRVRSINRLGWTKFTLSHLSMHLAWYSWLQGRTRSVWRVSNSHMQMTQVLWPPSSISPENRYDGSWSICVRANPRGLASPNRSAVKKKKTQSDSNDLNDDEGNDNSGTGLKKPISKGQERLIDILKEPTEEWMNLSVCFFFFKVSFYFIIPFLFQ